MKMLILIFLLITNAFALDAVVTVLESPMFKEKSTDSMVVQYLRKGDVIKIDPALSNVDKYDHLGKYKRPEPDSNEEFIMTWDRQGNKVWVFKHHLYIYYENKNEFDQLATTSHDETDYRLEEPLPKKYPLYSPTGYRGLFSIGITQPYDESYHYNSDVKAKGYQSPLDFNLTLLKGAPDDKNDRLYLGGTLNVRSFTNSYSLFNGHSSEEQGFRLGLGPTISYDTFKGEKDRVVLYGSVIVNLFDQLIITQKDKTGNEDERTYRTINVSPKIGLQYQRKKILEDIDFVIGTSLEMEPQSTYRSKNAARQSTWWRHGGNDKFNTRATFTLAGYLGIQSAY